MPSRPAACLALLVLSIAACGDQEAARAPAPPPAAPSATPAPRPASPSPSAAGSQGADLFAARCVTCHGPHGDGQGPASAGLTPKPRDFRDPAWQARTTDAHIERIIAQGGAAVGLSPLMPPHPDLAADPAKLAALRAHVRSFKP